MHADRDNEPSCAGDGSSRGERRDVRRARRRQRTRRFIEQYEQRRAARIAGDTRRFKRPLRIVTGVLLILAGIAIGWLPGPGFVIFALPGAFLLASEIRRAALLMDHIENVTVPRMRRVRARLRGGPMPEWVEDDPAFWADWCEARGRELPEQIAALLDEPEMPGQSASERTTGDAGTTT